MPRPQLTDKHLKLARSIANSYSVGEVTHCDFRSLAYYGLALALEGYREGTGASFETYARIRINGAIKDYLRKVDTLTRYGRKAVRSLDEPYTGGLYPLEEAGHLTASGPDPERQAQLALLVAVLMPAIAKLPKRLRQAIHLIDLEERSQAEAAAVLGIGNSTVAGYRQRALARLRETLIA